jgi:hypothetical protein
MDETAVARRVAIAWGDAFGGASVCIEATRYGIEALRRLGVKAWPMPCEVVVMNQLGFRLAVDGVPAATWPPRAYSVGINPGLKPNRSVHKGWNGHLVVGGAGFLADLTFAAFSRPERDMATWAGAWDKGREIHKVNNEWVAVSDDIVFWFTPRCDLTRWRTSGAWRCDIEERFVDRLVEAGARAVGDADDGQAAMCAAIAASARQHRR